MIINHDSNPGVGHGQGLAERAGFAHQHAAAVAEGTVDGLDDAGLALAFGTGPVLPAGQDGGVGFPLVGEVPAVAAVTPGQGGPQAPQRRFAPAAQRPGHDAATGPFDHEPQPHLALFAAHKAP